MDELALAIKNILSIAGAFMMALLARFIAHAEYARMNNEPFISGRLFFEAAAAGFCGMIALGVGEYFLLGPLAVNALGGIFGYLGPRLLVAIITSITQRK